MSMTPRARAIDRAVADAWREVRWAEHGGAPVCPICFDGEDLEPRPADERNPALRRYHCRACDRLLSDVSGTWIAPLKAPLVRWVWLLESDRAIAPAPPLAPSAMAYRIGTGWDTIVAMRERMQAAPPGFLDRWLAELRMRGVTLPRLVSAVEGNRT